MKSLRGHNLIITIISLVSCIYIAASETPTAYTLLPLLPLTFMLSYLLFIGLKNGVNSVVKSIVIAGSIIRMVIVPVFITIGSYRIWFGYYSTIMSETDCESVMPLALIIMCYEQIAIMWSVRIFCKESEKDTQKTVLNNKIRIKQGKLLYSITFIVLILFVVVAGIRYPSLRNYITFVLSDKSLVGNAMDVQSSTPSVIYRLYIWFVDMLQLIIPSSIVLWLKKSRISSGIKIVIFAIVDLTVLCFMTDDKAMSFILAILLIMVRIKYRSSLI